MTVAVGAGYIALVLGSEDLSSAERSRWYHLQKVHEGYLASQRLFPDGH